MISFWLRSLCAEFSSLLNSLLLCYPIIAHPLARLCHLAQRPLSGQIHRSYNTSANCEVRPVAIEPLARRCDHDRVLILTLWACWSSISNARASYSGSQVWLVCRAGSWIVSRFAGFAVGQTLTEATWACLLSSSNYCFDPRHGECLLCRQRVGLDDGCAEASCGRAEAGPAGCCENDGEGVPTLIPSKSQSRSSPAYGCFARSLRRPSHASIACIVLTGFYCSLIYEKDPMRQLTIMVFQYAFACSSLG